MRFGGFSERSYGQAVIRIMKDNLVFRNSIINTPKNELILHFTGPRHLHSKASMIDHYTRAISYEISSTASIKGFSLVKSTSFEINPKEIDQLITETIKYLFPQLAVNSEHIIRHARWHDVVVALVILRLFKRKDLLFFAEKILSVCSQADVRFDDIVKNKLLGIN